MNDFWSVVKAVSPLPFFIDDLQKEWFLSEGRFAGGRGLPQSEPARLIWPVLAAQGAGKKGEGKELEVEEIARLCLGTNVIDDNDYGEFLEILSAMQKLKFVRKRKVAPYVESWERTATLYRIRDFNQVDLHAVPNPTERSVRDQAEAVIKEFVARKGSEGAVASVKDLTPDPKVIPQRGLETPYAQRGGGRFQRGQFMLRSQEY